MAHDIRTAIVAQAGDGQLDELTGRLANRLAFAAFAGIAATRLGLWTIRRKTILAAFALVLEEHVHRYPARRTSQTEAAVDAVRAYIETHRAKFPALSSANDPNVRSGISGYFTEDRKYGDLFLFIPKQFRKLFDEFGEDVFTALRGQGFLVTQAGRHNLFEKRVPHGADGSRARMLFVAVRSRIRYVTELKTG